MFLRDSRAQTDNTYRRPLRMCAVSIDLSDVAVVLLAAPNVDWAGVSSAGFCVRMQ
jgi:hypothetical protein